MNKKWWGGGVVALGASLGMVVAGLSATAETAETGTTPAPGNTCANPVLASAVSGWGLLRGGSQQRDTLPAGDHPVAGHAYELEAQAGNQWNGNLSFYLPQQRVVPGEKWEFAADQRIDTFGADPGGRVRMEVDWYDAAGGYLGQHAGAWVTVTAGSPGDWTRIATAVTTPPNAARANVLTDLDLGSAARVRWAATACDYHRNAGGEFTVAATALNENQVRVDWTTTRTDITGWTVARDGRDDGGSGPWSTQVPAANRSHVFNDLIGTYEYTFTITPRTAAGPLAPLTVKKQPGPARPPTPTPTPTPTGEPGGSTSAAVKYGWGAPHESSDEFNYVGVPDPAKWSLPSGNSNQGNKPGCWDGHNGNGWRCEANARADGNALVMQGEANGESGWMRSRFSADYGRWEVRSRSRNVGTTGGLYHVLHLLWPSSERWPQDGEYDWLEYTNPDAGCAEAWLHYPHNAGIATQQEHAQKCPVDLRQWHNFAFEWTPEHVKGYIDGVPWFTYANGANAQRRNMQDMQPFGRYTMQLDNFTGDGGLRPAVFEMDSYHFYPLR